MLSLDANCDCSSGLAVLADDRFDRKLLISVCWALRLASARALVHLSPSLQGQANLLELVVLELDVAGLEIGLFADQPHRAAEVEPAILLGHVEANLAQVGD